MATAGQIDHIIESDWHDPLNLGEMVVWLVAQTALKAASS